MLRASPGRRKWFCPAMADRQLCLQVGPNTHTAMLMMTLSCPRSLLVLQCCPLPLRSNMAGSGLQSPRRSQNIHPSTSSQCTIPTLVLLRLQPALATEVSRLCLGQSNPVVHQLERVAMLTRCRRILWNFPLKSRLLLCQQLPMCQPTHHPPFRLPGSPTIPLL